MFTAIVFWLVLSWNWLLQTIGRLIGQMTGGFVLGYNQGLRDLDDMQQYMRWRSVVLRSRREEETEGGNNDKPF